MIEWVAGIGAGVTGGALALGYAGLRAKGLHRWLWTYLKTAHLRKDWVPGEPLRLLLCICDHYEPKRGNVSMAKARQRVQDWLDLYPKLFDRFRDSTGNPPRHTFFYPQDEYEPELVDMVASLCRKGYGEVEVHLHHDHDTADQLREKLLSFKEILHNRHGLLSRDRTTGEIAYAFIHGNWALDNSRSDGRWCGVDNEIDVLRETGCYADFTMPSAPDETQTRIINQIYWAEGRPGHRKSHNRGVELGVKPKPERGLLMVQGPLLLDWSRRKWGILPAIENGNLQNNQPPTENRLGLWLRARISLPKLPNTVIVKLHTHGVHEPNQEVLLGELMAIFHETLQKYQSEQQNFVLEYVSARELTNMVLSWIEPVRRDKCFAVENRYA